MKEITLTQLHDAIVANTAAVAELAAVIKDAKLLQTATSSNSESHADTSNQSTESDNQDEASVLIRDVETALLEVKGKFGSEAAKAILKDVAGVASLKRAELVKYKDILAACEAKMQEEVKTESSESTESEKVEDAKTPNHTLGEIQEVAKKLGGISKAHLTKAKEIINEVGGAAKTSEVPTENYDALYEALVAAMEDDEDGDL